MSERVRSLRRRLAKAERTLAKLPQRKYRGKCNCPVFLVENAMAVDKFEAAMNLECPEHGFAWRTHLVSVEHIGAGKDCWEKQRRLDQLVAEYEERRRLATIAERKGKVEDGIE